jgi:hypothetical protein
MTSDQKLKLLREWLAATKEENAAYQVLSVARERTDRAVYAIAERMVEGSYFFDGVVITLKDRRGDGNGVTIKLNPVEVL